MEFLLSLVQSISDFGQTLVDFFNHIPDFFHDIFIYLNAWIVKVKLYFLLMSLKISYETAQYLLNEIGFTQMVVTAFNSLPDEIRYYAFLFKIPQALTIYFNCMATGFVIKMSRV